MTYSDPNQSDIYVYNGIFFSRAEDTRDAFKISEGEEAARKTTSRDMINQKIVRSFGKLSLSNGYSDLIWMV